MAQERDASDHQLLVEGLTQTVYGAHETLADLIDAGLLPLPLSITSDLSENDVIVSVAVCSA